MDLNSIKKTDLGALIAGGLAFILSLFGAYLSVSYDGPENVPGYDGGGISSAWVSYATFGVLLLIVATALIALKVFARQVLPPGIPWNLIAAGAAGLGTLLIVLRAFTYPNYFGVDVGPGWSAWPLFIAAIALTVFAALGFKESGEQLPWNQAGAGGSAQLGGQQGGWQQSGPTGAPGAHSAPGGAPYGSAPSGQPMPPPPGGAPMSPPPQQQQPPPGAPPPPPSTGGPTPPGQQPPPSSW